MNIKILNEATELSLAGKMTFPQVIKSLVENNTERYLADLVAQKKIY